MPTGKQNSDEHHQESSITIQHCSFFLRTMDLYGIRWMITEEMRSTQEHDRIVFEGGYVVRCSSDHPNRLSLLRNNIGPRRPRSPTPKKDTAESSAPKRSTVICFRLPERKSTRLTPPAPVPIVDKAMNMIVTRYIYKFADTKVPRRARS
ncbi:hypothetical protein Tco_1538090 [Tanacetum coccineum]